MESEHLWKRSWLYAAHDSELPDPGSYKLCDIAGAPVSGEWLTDNAPSLAVAVGLAIRHIGDEAA